MCWKAVSWLASNEFSVSEAVSSTLLAFDNYVLEFRGVKLIFTRDRISLVVAFKGPNVILGLYKLMRILVLGGIVRYGCKGQIHMDY